MRVTKKKRKISFVKETALEFPLNRMIKGFLCCEAPDNDTSLELSFLLVQTSAFYNSHSGLRQNFYSLLLQLEIKIYFIDLNRTIKNNFLRFDLNSIARRKFLSIRKTHNIKWNVVRVLRLSVWAHISFILKRFFAASSNCSIT